MSDGFRFWLGIVLGVIGVFIAYKILITIVSVVLAIAVPVALVAGVGWVLYAVVGRKALGGGRRLLP